MMVKKKQLEPSMEQLNSSGLRKEYNCLLYNVYCHPVYLTYTQSTSWEMPDWMSYKLESRLLGEISTTTSDMWMKAFFFLMTESEEELKSLLMKVKEEIEKVGLELSIKMQKSWHPVPSLCGK